jgi:nitroreductase
MLVAVELYEAVTTTRAIRRYRPDPIPDTDLATMFFAATRAPSGSNRQPFRFLVLRDGPRAAEARQVLGEGFRAMWADKRTADRYDQGTGADRSSPKARMAATMEHFVDHVHEAPVIVLACVRHWQRGHFTEGASVYPACQNLLLTARSLGYGGVITMWHRAVEDRLVPVLGLPDGVSLAATIPMGRPAGHHGPVRRLPLDQFVYEDGWDEPAAWAVDPEGTRTLRPRPNATDT